MINTIEKASLVRQIGQLNDRIKRLERILQGQEISGVKIRDFSWDKGSGGTLRLGGENNTDGDLKIYDAFDQLRGVLNKDGLTLYDGSIAIYNKDGDITIDDKGIVSSVNFTNSVTSYGTTQEITSTSYTDLINSERDITVERETLCLFSLVMPASLTETVSDTGNTVTFIDINGVKSNSGAIFIFSGNNHRHTYSITFLKVLPAGTHTCKVTSRFESKTGSPILQISEYTFSHVLFGT